MTRFAATSRRLGALTIGLAIVSCGCRVKTDGPLGRAGETTEICVSATNGTDATIGDQVFRPTSDVLVSAVHLIGAKDIELIQAVFLPVPDGATVLGTDSQFPPTDAKKYRWDQRLDSDGAKLSADSTWSVALGLKALANDAVADHVEIDYESGGRKYRFVGGTKLRVSLPPEPCK